MRDFIRAIAFPYCGYLPRGSKERGKKATRGKQRDLACSDRREVAIRTEFEWGQSSRRQKEGMLQMPLKAQGRGLHGEQNCNEMAAARGYAIANGGKLRRTPLRKGCSRKEG